MRRAGRGVKWKVAARTPHPEPHLCHFADTLERLPAMTHQNDLGILPPSRWQPAAPLTF